MSKLTWDNIGERLYETGVEKGVLYPFKNGSYSKGVAWNGLTAVNERPSGAEPNPLYADNIKYLNLMSAEEFAAMIEAYDHPKECGDCFGQSEIADGVYIGQQNRKHFGLVYKTRCSDANNKSEYKLHILFNCLLSATEQNHTTVGDTPEAVVFSWELTADKHSIPNFKPSSSLVLDSEKLTKAGFYNLLKFFEDTLYGTDTTDPGFLSLKQIVESIPKVIYLRDSGDDAILDSYGNRIQSVVYE